MLLVAVILHVLKSFLLIYSSSFIVKSFITVKMNECLLTSLNLGRVIICFFFSCKEEGGEEEDEWVGAKINKQTKQKYYQSTKLGDGRYRYHCLHAQ